MFLDGNEDTYDCLPGYGGRMYLYNAILSLYQDMLNIVHCENDVKLVRTLRALKLMK